MIFIEYLDNKSDNLSLVCSDDDSIRLSNLTRVYLISLSEKNKRAIFVKIKNKKYKTIINLKKKYRFTFNFSI